MARKRHYPPSRLRYDQSHPTISVRVDRELFDRLQDLKGHSGKSIGDILREALGVQAPATKKAYDRGYKKGTADAERRYRIQVPCKVCRGLIPITSRNGKETAARLLHEAGWGHLRCRG